MLLVFFGCWHEKPDDPSTLHEVHLYISGRYLVTVHREPLPVLERQREQLDGRVLHSEQFVLYRVLDALTDSFFPVLSEMDERIDALETEILGRPTDPSSRPCSRSSDGSWRCARS